MRQRRHTHKYDLQMHAVFHFCFHSSVRTDCNHISNACVCANFLHIDGSPLQSLIWCKATNENRIFVSCVRKKMCLSTARNVITATKQFASVIRLNLKYPLSVCHEYTICELWIQIAIIIKLIDAHCTQSIGDKNSRPSIGCHLIIHFNPPPFFVDDQWNERKQKQIIFFSRVNVWYDVCFLFCGQNNSAIISVNSMKCDGVVRTYLTQLLVGWFHFCFPSGAFHHLDVRPPSFPLPGHSVFVRINI